MDNNIIGRVTKDNLTLVVYYDDVSNISDIIDTLDLYFWKNRFRLNGDKAVSAIENLQENGGVLIPAEYISHGSDSKIQINEDRLIKFPIEPYSEDLNKIIKNIDNSFGDYDLILPPKSEDFDSEDDYNSAVDDYESDFNSNIIDCIKIYLNDADWCDGFSVGSNYNEAIGAINELKNAIENDIICIEILDNDTSISSNCGYIVDVNDVSSMSDVLEDFINGSDNIYNEDLYSECEELIKHFSPYEDIDLNDNSNNIDSNIRLINPSDFDKLL